jgi:hypothetical protein
MASTSRSQRPYEYLDAFLATVPNYVIPQEIANVSRGANFDSSPYPKFLDAALRLVAGGPSRPDDAPHLRDAWPETQATVQRTLHALHHPSSPHPPPNTKRKHPLPSSSSSPPATTNQKKKPKFEQAGDADEGVDDDDNDDDGDDDDEDDDGDAAHLTLHALSTTAPVRHKVDITLRVRTLRLTHSTTGAAVGCCARAALTRAFLLPTRARSSGALQWAALLLAGDKPTAPAPRPRGARGKDAKKKGARGLTTGTARFELACSVTDSSSAAAVPRMTVHAPTFASASASPSQATSPREALLTLLTSAISGTPVTLTTAERGAPLAGITAFRGVRETSLWFFDGVGAGILADARPAEFWAVADLARGEAGVRVRTATGRTCSVVLTRLATPENDGKDEDEEMGEGDGEEGEETEFQMIDGKERERVLEWVRRHRNAFGISKAQRGAQEGERAAAAVAAAESKGMDAEGMDAGGDSDSDSDFEASSLSSDGSSPSSSPGSGPGSDDAGSEAVSVAASGESGGDAVESDRGSQDEDDDDDDKEAVELDPKHHPLLRAGALPKMSHAAMDAAVGLVVGDLLGHPQVREHGHDDGDDEEEDELDD